MRTLNDYFLTATIPTMEDAATLYVPVPDSGRIVKVSTALSKAIGTADEDITIKTAQGTVAPVLTITQPGSAAGDVDSIAPTANNYVTEGETIEIENDGASSGTLTACTVTLVIRR